MPLINWEVKLDLFRARNCLRLEDDENLANTTLQINSTKIYIPLLTLSVNVNIRFLQNLKQELKKNKNILKQIWV